MNDNRSIKLTDILAGSQTSELARAWETTEAAEELRPISPGEYTARIIRGELFQARTGTGGYKITFEIADGEHVGRYVWHDVWLTAQAMAISKRDLGKLGISNLQQLEHPLPAVLLGMVKVVIRQGDDGSEYNHVRSFEVTGIEENPFAPGTGSTDGANSHAHGEPNAASKKPDDMEAF